MTEKRYNIIQIDSFDDVRALNGSQSRADLGNNHSAIEFQFLIHNFGPNRLQNLFILDDHYNKLLKYHYFNSVENIKSRQSCGFFIFNDACTIGHDSLIIDEKKSLVYIGQMINWSRDYFKWWIENSNVGFLRWEDENSFVADFGEAATGCNDGILMNSPGYGIFGHWLIDFVPRMVLSKLIKSHSTSTHLFGPLKDWMSDLVSKCGISNYDRLDISLLRHKRLIVPSSTNFGYGFFEPINTAAWRALALSFNCENIGKVIPSAKRIFVSRRYWNGGREISYHEELEALMAHLDFAVVHPEKLSLSEQALLFSQAEIIVGEDGSALHNIIFSSPGTKLGVLMDSGRSNLWHAGICHLLGHQVAYAPLPSASDDTSKGLTEIMTFARKLLQVEEIDHSHN